MKITRGQKQKAVERVKNIVIVLLCICSVFFLGQIIDLYGDGSKENDALRENRGFGSSDVNERESAISSYRKMTEPKKIIVGYENGIYEFDYAEESFFVVSELAENMIRSLYLNGADNLEKTDKDAREKALDGRFFLAEYPCVRMVDFEKRVFSLENSSFSSMITGYSELLMVMDETEQTIRVFVQDYDSENIYSMSVAEPFQKLDAVMKSVSEGGFKNYIFAKEVNPDPGEEKNLSLDSRFLMPIGEIGENKVISRVPQKYKDGIDFTNTTEFAVNLLNAFGFNHNTIRQYLDSDGKLIYVGERGTLRVSPDGQIEYKALTEQDGINIAESGDAYSVVVGIGSMNQVVLKVSGVGDEKNNASLKFIDFPEKSNSTEVKIVMEYFVDNRQALLGKDPSMEATIKNGILVEYKIKVKAIERLNNVESCGDILRAIDDFCLKNTEYNKVYDNEIIYRIDSDDIETPAVWDVKGV